MTRQDIIEKTIAEYWNVRDEYKSLALPELREVCRRDVLNYAVCAVNITGDLNLGMMIRTASLMGAAKFLIFGRPKYDKRSTVGAQNYIDIYTHDARPNPHSMEIDYSQLRPFLSKFDLYPVFFDTGGTNIEAFQPDYRYGSPCLVFGNEGMGIPSEVIGNDEVYTIPQRGVLRSLNVSSAASIAMYEVAKRLG